MLWEEGPLAAAQVEKIVFGLKFGLNNHRDPAHGHAPSAEGEGGQVWPALIAPMPPPILTVPTTILALATTVFAISATARNIAAGQEVALSVPPAAIRLYA